MAIAGMALTACVAEDEPAADKPAGDSAVLLSFDISPMSATSASAECPTQPGTATEDYIFDGPFLNVYIHEVATGRRIFFFSHDNQVPGVGWWDTDADGKRHANVHLALKAGVKYRISVMANSSQSITSDLYDVCPNYRNETDNPNFLKAPYFAPMSGFRTFTITPDAQGNVPERLELGVLWLLRASAKIEIKFSDDVLKEWVPSNVRALGGGRTYLDRANVSPLLANVNKYDCTEDMLDVDIFNPKDGSTMTDPAGQDIPFGQPNTGTLQQPNEWQLYLPEQRNPVAAGGEEIAFGVTMKHIYTGVQIPCKLYLRNPDTEQPVNITRNHIYRLTVTRVTPLLDVDFTVLTPSNKTITVPPFN